MPIGPRASQAKSMVPGSGLTWRTQSRIESAVGTATSMGPLRIAVDCAGIATPTKLIRKGRPTPLEDFAKVLAVNLLGTINVLRCAAAAMAEAEPVADGDRGVCVLTASIAAYEGQIGQVAY